MAITYGMLIQLVSFLICECRNHDGKFLVVYDIPMVYRGWFYSVYEYTLCIDTSTLAYNIGSVHSTTGHCPCFLSTLLLILNSGVTQTIITASFAGWHTFGACNINLNFFCNRNQEKAWRQVRSVAIGRQICSSPCSRFQTQQLLAIFHFLRIAFQCTHT